MRRRDVLLSALAVAAMPSAWAQTAKAPRRVGLLSENSQASAASITFVRAQLRELGRVEGRDYVFEGRWGDGKIDRLPVLARELLALKPDVILALSGPALAAMKQATTSVPIVFANVGEPVERGYVASLSNPGDNVTGTTFRHEVFGKLVELVRDCLPSARRLAALELDTDPVSKRVTAHFERAADALGIAFSVVRTKRPDQLDRPFAELRDLKAQAVLLPPQFYPQAKPLVERAIKEQLPTFGSLEIYTEAGGLISLFNDTAHTYSRAAVLIDKILKGAKPADLPVEQPERFVMVANIKTAAALGLKIPQSVLLRADRVIE